MSQGLNHLSSVKLEFLNQFPLSEMFKHVTVLSYGSPKSSKYVQFLLKFIKKNYISSIFQLSNPSSMQNKILTSYSTLSTTPLNFDQTYFFNMYAVFIQVPMSILYGQIQYFSEASQYNIWASRILWLFFFFDRQYLEKQDVLCYFCKRYWISNPK